MMTDISEDPSPFLKCIYEADTKGIDVTGIRLSLSSVAQSHKKWEQVNLAQFETVEPLNLAAKAPAHIEGPSAMRVTLSSEVERSIGGLFQDSPSALNKSTTDAKNNV